MTSIANIVEGYTSGPIEKFTDSDNKTWLKFESKDVAPVNAMIEKLGPKPDGLQVTVANGEWYHVWARLDDTGNTPRVTTIGFTTQDEKDIAHNLISSGNVKPIGFSSTGKTLYILQKSHS